MLTPRPVTPGTAIVLLTSSNGDHLLATQLRLGAHSLKIAGDAPKSPRSNTAARLSLPPGDYALAVAGPTTSTTSTTTTPSATTASTAPKLTVRSGQVTPLLLAVKDGRVVEGGIYAGLDDVNLGFQELSGRLTPIADFHLTDQDGRAVDRKALLGRDTVIAAFHTTCHETCPLYTGLMFQLRKAAPDVRLLEVTTDPATDTPSALSAYRSSIGADWQFATGQPDDLVEFWAPFGVTLSVGDTHTSVLVLVDRFGFVRASETGVPDLGGRLPTPLESQLDPAGLSLLKGHGEGWGAPQVLDQLRILGRWHQPAAEGEAATFNLPTLDGGRLSLDEVRGRPVILNFWWAGCPPCRQEMPILQRYVDSHPGVALLLVDPVDGHQTASTFTQSVHVRAPVLLDDSGRVAAAYQVSAYPTTFFLRSDGTIASRYPLALTPEALTAHMSNLGDG